MNRQRAYGELMLAPITRRPVLPRPYGDYMPGAQRAGLIYDGTLNRAMWWWDGQTVSMVPRNVRDENHSLPPDPEAIRGVATILRAPARYGLGAGGIHAFFDLERADGSPYDLPVILDAVRVLRANTAASQRISVYAWPGWEFPNGTAADRAELASLVSSLVMGAYSLREHARDPGLWERQVRETAARWRQDYPRRTSGVAFVCPLWQIYYDDWPDVEHLRDKPVGKARWREQLAILRSLGFTPFNWGMTDSLAEDPAVAPYTAIANAPVRSSRTSTTS